MIRSKLRNTPRKFDGGRVEMRQTAIRIRRVDRGRQSVDHFSKTPLALALPGFHQLSLTDVDGKNLTVQEFAVFKYAVGGDEHIADDAIPGPEARFEIPDGLAAIQLVE